MQRFEEVSRPWSMPGRQSSTCEGPEAGHSGVFHISQMASLPGTEQDMKEQWGEGERSHRGHGKGCELTLTGVGSQWRVLRQKGHDLTSVLKCSLWLLF